jgi:hypothetical protein
MLCIENFQKYICQNECIGTKVMHIQIINVLQLFLQPHASLHEYIHSENK